VPRRTTPERQESKEENRKGPLQGLREDGTPGGKSQDEEESRGHRKATGKQGPVRRAQKGVKSEKNHPQLTSPPLDFFLPQGRKKESIIWDRGCGDP